MYLFLTAADSTGAAGGGASMILMFVVLIAVFYFFMIRPENKRKKEAQQMRDSLKVGDNITTIGGIIGDIVSIKDNSIVIETTASALSLQSLLFPPTTRRKRKLPSRRPQLWLPARSRRKKRRRPRRINNCLTPYKAAKIKCPQKVRQNYEHNLFKQPKGPAACGSQTAGPSALP